MRCSKFWTDQPISNAWIIVLSEHVDYWNGGGWVDPFSSHRFSLRQEEYSRHFNLGGPYTPEKVVDGRVEFVGSDRGAAFAAIRSAAQESKVPIRISPAAAGLAVHVDPLPAGRGRKAGVFVAHAADAGVSDVRRGENKGRRLRHVSVARDLEQLGSVTDRSGFDGAIPAASGGARVVVFRAETPHASGAPRCIRSRRLMA